MGSCFSRVQVGEHDDVGRGLLEGEVEGVMAHRPGVDAAGERRLAKIALHRPAVRADGLRVMPRPAAHRAMLDYELALAQAIPKGLALARRLG
jgi:hypothetical protein